MRTANDKREQHTITEQHEQRDVDDAREVGQLWQVLGILFIN